MENKELQAQDELHLQITKADGEVLVDEWGCTVISYLVTCRGEMARSFLGAHNTELIKIISKVQKDYIKQVGKAVKAQEKKQKEEIKVIKKKSKADDKMLENVDLSKAKDQIDELSEEYDVDVQKILQDELEKFKAEKKKKDAKNESMSDLDPSLEQEYRNAKRAEQIMSKTQKPKQTKKATTTVANKTTKPSTKSTTKKK